MILQIGSFIESNPEATFLIFGGTILVLFMYIIITTDVDEGRSPGQPDPKEVQRKMGQRTQREPRRDQSRRSNARERMGDFATTVKENTLFITDDD